MNWLACTCTFQFFFFFLILHALCNCLFIKLIQISGQVQRFFLLVRLLPPQTCRVQPQLSSARVSESILQVHLQAARGGQLLRLSRHMGRVPRSPHHDVIGNVRPTLPTLQQPLREVQRHPHLQDGERAQEDTATLQHG